MLKQWHKIVFLVASLFLLSTPMWATDEIPVQKGSYLDSAKLVSQQIELLKVRLSQAQKELADAQRLQEKQLATLSLDQVNKQLLNRVGLNITVAKSNLDSIYIELTESQQSLARLEKDIQETENQLNMYSMFGLKIIRNEIPNLNGLQSSLTYQKSLYLLEKTRNTYLLKLRDAADSTMQLYKSKYARINTLLKSRTIIQLKEQQAHTEVTFQQRQGYWLKELDELSDKLNALEFAQSNDKNAYKHIERDIFYANENVNLNYLQMLIARYEDQIEQLRASLARGSSITLLNKMSEQAQLLGKQLARVDDSLKKRMVILEKRNVFLLTKEKMSDDLTRLHSLGAQYKAAMASVASLNQQLAAFRSTLDQALQNELSSRQGLPGFSERAWLDVGNEILLVPVLTFQIMKSLVHNFHKALTTFSSGWWVLLALLQIAWLAAFYFVNKWLKRIVSEMADHEHGHINLRWLGTKLVENTLIGAVTTVNVISIFIFCGIPFQNFSFITNLMFVWLFFKAMLAIARLCLVDSVHNNTGHDARLYSTLKWMFLVNGVVTALTVFVNQLPVIFELKDFFDRAFLLCLLVVSLFFLKNWRLVPNLILPHIDERRLYLQRIVCLLGILIPLILAVNSVIGLFGFINLVMSVSWYESIFVLVLVAYLVLRGLLNEVMMRLSSILVSYVDNGWLWMEAFLKPIDRVLRVTLFLSAWAALFLFYGWDQQSPVVERLTKLSHYHVVDILDTSITPLSILELIVVVSFLYWAARWTREFVFRALATRTQDMGLRNSIAIFSQYSMVIAGIFICLRVLGIDLRTLGIVASAFAFGVGLGLRDLANNFACGLLLLIERPLRVGDTVTIGGHEGEVTHIGGRAVTVLTWDRMEVVVPNTEVFTKSFVNWTAKDPIVRTVITIKISRHDSPHDVQALIHRVLANHKDVLSSPAPEVLLKELSDALIEFEVRYFVNLRQVPSRIGVRSEVLVMIWEAFEKHGIKPPYPHHEITVKGSAPLLAAVPNTAGAVAGTSSTYEMRDLI